MATSAEKVSKKPSGRPYDCLLWDWNGTLLDDAALCLESLNSVLQKHHLPVINLETYRKGFNFPVYGFYETLGFKLTAEVFRQVSIDYHAYYESHRKGCPLHKGAREVLQELKASGVPQVILSAHEQTRLESTLDDYQLTPFFREICGTDSIDGRGKLDNARILLTRLGFPPERCLLIGDTGHDFEVAQAVGISCILFTGGHFSAERLAAKGTRLIDSLTEVRGRLGVVSG
jgi:phosphoglycolate phosphatase